MSKGAEVKQKLQGMSNYENMVFLELVNAQRDTIECRRTDIKSIRNKARVWKEIERAFCSNPNTTNRTAGQLRTRWKNCKLRSKPLYVNARPTTTRRHENIAQTSGPGISGAEGLTLEAENMYETEPSEMTLVDPLESENDQSGMINVSYETIEQKHVPSHTQSSSPNVDTPTEFMHGKATNPADFEYAEHQMRLKILATNLETAKILKQKAEMELSAVSNEHQLRMQLLTAQLGNAHSGQSILP